MPNLLFSTYGISPALAYARNALRSWGYAVTDEAASATHILLPVPSLEAPGIIKGGLSFPTLPKDATVIGGNLPPLPYKTVDLLTDPYYLLENAAITAQCALHYAQLAPNMPVLVIGWGRIGKHLAALLSELGAQVTVAVRNTDHLQALQALGITAVLTAQWNLKEYAVIFNTAPAPLLQETDCRHDAQLIDLASTRGIEGKNVIWARGLPGKDAPELSGALIAKTALRHALEGGTYL